MLEFNKITALSVAMCSIFLSACTRTYYQTSRVTDSAGIPKSVTESTRKTQQTQKTSAFNSQQPGSDKRDNSNQDQREKDTLQLTKYVKEQPHGWRMKERQHVLTDLYGSFVIRADATQVSETRGFSPDSPHGSRIERYYDKERRGFLARIFLGSYEKSTTASVQIKVIDPDLKFSHVLFSISHSSKRDQGESFVTHYTSSNVEPLPFRIGANTRVSFQIHSKVSETVKADSAISKLLAVIETVNGLFPNAGILTEKVKPFFQKATNAIDVALAGLMSESIEETIDIGRYIDTWEPDADINVEAHVSGEDFHGGKGKDLTVGRWKIIMRCPRLSAFDPTSVCKQDESNKTTWRTQSEITQERANVRARATASLIMGFEIGGAVKLGEYISASPWVAALLSEKPISEANFCTMMAQNLFAQGFNAFDAGLAVHAAAETLPGVVTKRSAILADNICRSIISGAPIGELKAEKHRIASRAG